MLLCVCVWPPPRGSSVVWRRHIEFPVFKDNPSLLQPNQPFGTGNPFLCHLPSPCPSLDLSSLFSRGNDFFSLFSTLKHLFIHSLQHIDLSSLLAVVTSELLADLLTVNFVTLLTVNLYILTAKHSLSPRKCSYSSKDVRFAEYLR